MSILLTPVDPRYLEFQDWALAIRSINKNIPRPHGEPQWRDWAARIVQIDRDAPYPDRFTDWRAWAIQWIATV